MTTETKTPKQLTIAVDLDNTSAEYTQGLRLKVAQLLGTSLADLDASYPLVTDYTMWNNGWVGMNTKEQFYNLHSQAVENGLFEDLVPYDGVSETLWKFHDQGHFIRIVTARFLKPGDRFKVMETTSKFLDAYDIPVDDIAFTARKVDVMADVYIDDSPSNIKNLTAAGRTVIIYHQEYNKDLEGLRAYNWNDVERLVNELAAA